MFGAEARALIAADVLISTNREWTPTRRARRSTARLAEAGATARTETLETPTMVRPADESKAVARMVELRAVAGRTSRSTARSCSTAGTPTRTRCCKNHGVARPAGAADGARRQGRRPARHRPGDVHDPRRHRERAGPADRRLQPRPARAHRLRRSAGDRPARLRQPRAIGVLHVKAPEEPARGAGQRRCAASFSDEFVNARSYRVDRGSRSAATSSAPRTT